jgi:hypothetical protein
MPTLQMLGFQTLALLLLASTCYGELMFSEIMYKPDTGGDEFLEFKNNGATPFDASGILTSLLSHQLSWNVLIGYVLVSAINFEFPPNTIIEPSSFYVIASNSSSFLEVYGTLPNATYSVTYPHCESSHSKYSQGRLSSKGESILLYDRYHSASHSLN